MSRSTTARQVAERRSIRTGIATAALVTGLLVSPLLGAPTSASADTAPPAGTPSTVSADGLPTVQINGVVWNQVVVGNTVYATGSFSKARPAGAAAGTSETTRSNLLAYDITTGNLITTFNHSLNGQGLAIAAAADGSRIYVGGDFTTVDGTPRGHVAAFDTSTGSLVGGFAPSVGGQVASLAVTATTVYAGGTFTRANGADRTNAAAFTVGTAALLPWIPAPDASITAMTTSPDGARVILGGRFYLLNGSVRRGLGAVDATTGGSVSWTNPPMFDYGLNSAFTSLTRDGQNIYGTAYNYSSNGGAGNFEGRFAIKSDGTLVWIDDCHGDSYSIYPVGNVVYSASHSHNCATQHAFPETNPRTWHRAIASTAYATQTALRNTQSGYANFKGQPAPTQLDWYPAMSTGNYTGAYQGPWSVSGNSQYVVMGGEFLTVNGVGQQGLVRYAQTSIAPNKRGPTSSTALTPVAASSGSSAISVTWTETSDVDNSTLTYFVLRDSSNIPVGAVTADSRFWSENKLTYTDSGAPPGPHTYRIQAMDPFANATTSASSNSATVVTNTADAAPNASFTARCTQLSCSFDATASSDTDGSIVAYSWLFGDGGSAAGVTTTHTYARTGSFPVRLVVTDNRGIIGQYAVTVAATSAANQPPVAAFTATCTQLDCTFDGTGSSDSDGNITSYAWTFGDNTTGAGSTTSHPYAAAGTYTVTLTVTDNNGTTNTTSKVITVSSSPPTNQPPLAAFTATCTQLNCTFDGTGSSDSDGNITSYAWTFGDNATATASTTSHAYAAAGTYTVTLTVTDNGGAARATSRTVTASSTAAVFALDTFNRSVSAGLGSADVGGPWTSTTGASRLSVAPTSARFFASAPGQEDTALLNSATSTSTVMTATFSVDKPASGGGTYVSFIGRGIGSTGQYRATARISNTGSVDVYLSRFVASTAETIIGTSVTVPGLTYTSGTSLNVEFRVTGTGTTSLSMKLWPTSTPEPAAAQVSATDTTASLQSPGCVGLRTYLSSSATNAPVVVSFSSFRATTA